MSNDVSARVRRLLQEHWSVANLVPDESGTYWSPNGRVRVTVNPHFGIEENPDEDRTVIRAASDATREVHLSWPLLELLNSANADPVLYRIYWADHTVVVECSLLASQLSAESLAELCEYAETFALAWAPALVERHGGVEADRVVERQPSQHRRLKLVAHRDEPPHTSRLN